MSRSGFFALESESFDFTRFYRYRVPIRYFYKKNKEERKKHLFYLIHLQTADILALSASSCFRVLLCRHLTNSVSATKWCHAARVAVSVWSQKGLTLCHRITIDVLKNNENIYTYISESWSGANVRFRSSLKPRDRARFPITWSDLDIPSWDHRLYIIIININSLWLRQGDMVYC